MVFVATNIQTGARDAHRLTLKRIEALKDEQPLTTDLSAIVPAKLLVELSLPMLRADKSCAPQANVDVDVRRGSYPTQPPLRKTG
jgi:hypothetical protein